MLLTHELQKLAHFLLQSKEAQKEILERARLDPQTSGPLISAYVHCAKAYCGNIV